MSNYEPWQQRVIANKAAQDEKLKQLRDYYESSEFKNLSRSDKDGLRRQERFLEKYSGMLGLKIKRFGSNKVMTTEADPNGKSQHEPGAKLDAGKNRLGLVMCGFARALQEVGKVGTYGANKYTDNGWVEVPDGERRYTDAMLRHLMREATGEERDPDTGLHHAAHCCWNALARLDIMLRRTEEHDALHKSSRQESKN